MDNTTEEFGKAISLCRDIFAKKLSDYGASWRIMRPESVTDQIFIKVYRIRSLEKKKISKVNEGIKPEFIGIVNYGIIGLIQLEKGYSDTSDISYEEALSLYDKHIAATEKLMHNKNHDYDEAWRIMRVSSYTDIIFMKLNRTKEIENNEGKTIISEGIEANYSDIINYALFALIKLADTDD
jgi:hypothetical protein